MSETQNKFTRFWNELKRRKVVRVTIIYASTAFILLQLISILIQPLHLPQWVMTFFVVFLLVGFPIVVILSWIFDITPEGVERTATGTAGQTEEVPAKTSKKRIFILDTIIIVLLVIVAILVYPKIFKNENSGKANSELEKSIAVLPFRNDSPDEGNAYIINGLMEEILNKLEKIEDLKVVSRTTVERYRDTKLILGEIGKELNVNYIL
jgi:hypothetical protein